jgi:pyruvate kinase
MSLYWGISPYYFNIHENADLTKLGDLMIEELKAKDLLKLGEKVVITVGDGKFFRQGTTNSIRVEIIKDVPKALKNTDQDSIQEVSFDRGKLLLDTSICASCQACISVCPFEIWTASSDNNNETRINPLRAHKCTLDMACIEACPTGAIEIIPLNS